MAMVSFPKLQGGVTGLGQTIHARPSTSSIICTLAKTKGQR